MARPHDSAHRVADFIPQTVLKARHYGLRIATYPTARFIEPSAPEQRPFVVLIPASQAPPHTLGVRIAYVLASIALAVSIYFTASLFMGP